MIVSVLILLAMVVFWRWVSLNRKLQLESKKCIEEISSITIPLLKENISNLEKINTRDHRILKRFCGYNVNHKRKRVHPRTSNRGK